MLTRLPQLKDLSLQHTEISTIGLEQLAAVRSLERLDLGHTLLGDNALPMLASLTNLRALELPSTLVEGTGLAALQGSAEPARDRSRQRADCERGHGSSWRS